MKYKIIFLLITLFTCYACSENKTVVIDNPETDTETDTDTDTDTNTETEQPQMTQESFVSNNTTLDYWLYTPAKAESNLPLLIYLHGGSGKGNDLSILLENGFPKFLFDGDFGNLKAYVIIPQLSKDIMGWSNIATTLNELIATTVKNYHCNNSRIAITGHSMGGTGTWSIAAKFPKLFNRIAPLSGSITNTPVNLASLKESNIWAFVGSADAIVNPQSTIDFIDALNSSSAKYTIINDATHFDVPQAYLSQEYKLIDWLLAEEDITAIP